MGRGVRTHVQRNVVAYVALFLALGGSAYAATALPANSVGTRQLKNGAVTSPKLADGAVTDSKLRAGSITADKLSQTTLSGTAHPFAYRAATGTSATPFATIGPYTLSAQCPDVVSGSSIRIDVLVKGPAGHVDFSQLDSTGSTDVNGYALPANTNGPIAGSIDGAGNFIRLASTSFVVGGGKLLQIQLSAIVDDRAASPHCGVVGEATMTSAPREVTVQ